MKLQVIIPKKLQKQLNLESNKKIFTFETNDIYLNVDKISEYYSELAGRYINASTLKIKNLYPHWSYCPSCGNEFLKRNYHVKYCDKCRKQIHQENNSKAQRIWYSQHGHEQKNVQKFKTRNRSKYLLKTGALTKKKCAICKKRKRDLQFHHQMYDGKYAPYAVICVCPQCHRAIHKDKRTSQGE